MADIVREIEITAALSSDYQAAFNAASSIARSTSAELDKLTKREADLAKMTEIAGKAAAASAENDAKAVEKLQNEYNKLADKLGLVDRSAEGVAAELKRVGDSKKEIQALNKSAARSAEIGRLAKDITAYTKAAQKIKDPSLTAALEKMKKRFRELGGVIPDKKKPAGFFSTLRDGLTRVPGPMAGVMQSLSAMRDAFSTTGGKAAIAVGAVMAVGAAASKAAKAMWDLGVDTMRAGDQIAKTSRQLGIDAEAYQEFAYAVGLGGASEKDFETALRQLNKQMEAAQSGNKRATDAFRALGVSMDEVRSMNVEEMFVRLSDALSQVDDTAAKTRTTMALFGESGIKVATAIAGGSAELERLRKEARDAGYVLAGDSLKKAEEANDNFTRAQLQLRGVARQLGVEVMPVVNDMLVEFIQLIRDNREDLATFVQILGGGFSTAAVVAAKAVGTVNAAVEIFGEGLKFWQGLVADVLIGAEGLIFKGVDFVESVPGRVMAALGEVASRVGVWFGEAKSRVQSWITSVVNAVVQTILEKIDWLTSALRDVPLLGGLLGDSGPAIGGGSVTVNINNAVDARGADPGVGATVQRAIANVTSSSGERAAAALAEYNGLSYSGASR